MARASSTVKTKATQLGPLALIDALTAKAVQKKIFKIRYGEIEITMHPDAFLKDRPNHPPPADPEADLTPEEREERKKKQFEADLLWSVGGPEGPA